MPLIPRALTAPASRVASAAQNALEVARFGGLDTGEEPSPFEVVTEHPIYRLRRYLPAIRQRASAEPPAIVLVPPMMLAADVYDVRPTARRRRRCPSTASIRGWSTSARPSTRRAASSARSPTTCSR